MEAVLLKRLGFILVGLSLLVLSGAAWSAGHEVGHVSGGYDPDLGTYATLLSEGGVSPLPADDEKLKKPINIEGAWEILGGFFASDGVDPTSIGYLDGVSGATQLLVYNIANECWDTAPTEGGPAEGDFPFAIQDGGPYDADGTAGLVAAYFIAVKPYSAESGGGGGGGCSAAFLAPAALFLLAPLLMLRRRG